MPAAGWFYLCVCIYNYGKIGDGVEIYCNFLNEPGNRVCKPAPVYED
jgi:hypothetical protein